MRNVCVPISEKIGEHGVSALDMFLSHFGAKEPQVLAFIKTLRQALIASTPAMREWARTLRHAQELFDHWEQHAPQILSDTVHRNGMIVPISQMSFADLLNLLALHEREGDAAVVDAVRAEYDAIFGQTDFLERLASTWAGVPELTRRLPLLQAALRVHQLGIFEASVPLLFAQFEGLVVDLMQHTGHLHFTQLTNYVAQLSSEDGLIGHMLTGFVQDVLATQFKHGFAIPPLSRHAVLHGADVDYATETNSRTAILLIDQLRATASSGSS